MAVVVDASVLVAFLDPRDAGHEAATDAVQAAVGSGDELVLPASAYADVLMGAHLDGAAAVRTVEAFIQEAGIRVEPVTAAVARKAAQLRARHRRVGLPDALVLATGDVLDAGTILTADRAWRGVVPRVRVI